MCRAERRPSCDGWAPVLHSADVGGARAAAGSLGERTEAPPQPRRGPHLGPAHAPLPLVARAGRRRGARHRPLRDAAGADAAPDRRGHGRRPARLPLDVGAVRALGLALRGRSDLATGGARPPAWPGQGALPGPQPPRGRGAVRPAGGARAAGAHRPGDPGGSWGPASRRSSSCSAGPGSPAPGPGIRAGGAPWTATRIERSSRRSAAPATRSTTRACSPRPSGTG